MSKLTLLMLVPLLACGAQDPVNPSARGFVQTAAAGNGAPAVVLPTGNVGKGGNPDGNLLLPPAMAAPAADGTCNQDVDIVFVLDVSGSMTPALGKLKSEVTLVDQALQTKNLPHPPHYGLVIFVDQAQTMNMGMAYPDIASLQAALQIEIDKTNMDNPRELVGDSNNLSWTEDGLDGLYAAATEFQWRDPMKTLRTIIMITDASFWDGKEPSSGADSEKTNDTFPDHVSKHSYAETIAALRMQKIWTNTFSAMTGGPPDGKMAPASHGQWRGISVDVGIGYFTPYNNMGTIAGSTGGMAWDLDDVYDMKISLATPINMSIEAHSCAVYPM